MTVRTSQEGTDAVDLSTILLAVGTVAYEWDVASDRLVWSAGAHKTLGLPPSAQIDTATSFASLFDPEALTTRREAVFGSKQTDFGDGVAFEVEYPLMRGARDKRLWVQDRGRWYAGPDGRPARVVGLVRELGSRYEAAAHAASLSRFDALTGQLARPRLIEIAGAALAAGARMQTSTAFALVSLTNLGAINEAYGFDIGDIVIVEVSRRLRSAMRGGDTLGRFSTSTFGLVLQECERSDLEVAAQRLAAAIHDEPVTTAAGPIAVRIALGAVVAPRHARTVDDMVARARIALSRASELPSGLWIYAPDPDRDVARRANMKLADDLVAALNDRRVLLAYQPVARAATGEICWSEALARIVTATGEAVSGGPVAAAAEEVGLVHMLDRRALDLAIARLARDPQAQVAVNVSAATTGDETWSHALDGWLALRPDIAERLLVEITETAAIRDLAATRDFVSALKARGVRVAIDDFGAGHTSFKALRELKVDLVKIDGSFVSDLETSAESGAFVRALLALARELGFETVAEKVESAAVADLLRDWGATYLQGDFIAPPALD
ncbi:bifunctional diguanylate cyclase/phosphodiesterase [Chenggangzhangella methanolivorans]|uniref:Bifunctional diguanylate cyclase/phosphodiesterase n=2 Tax=Chenggangzhangella methanolivorans TaxID=1437009 RepID=A0A9E6R6E8_9HYPH|nr:bifunctional diguanylate cyclase/phosphodiesterase [Chenggangzhangella methanolivorans]QZN98659.1 bifunctional diguanylate cyclase/phosphodiesterase [Chenggangzhangella methanolivorans]